jgi:hypothetical protein
MLDDFDEAADGSDDRAGDGDGDGDGDRDDGDDGDDVDEEAEEAAQKAMGDLFVAADRLAGSPLDEGIADDFAALADDVADLPPPFGIDPSLWAQVGELATSVTEQLDAAAEEDVIASDARMLRELLRKYV